MASTSKRQGPFVIVYGTEDYYLDRTITRAKDTKNSIRILDGDGLSDAEFVSACEEMSPDGDPATIVLDNAHKLKGDAELKTFLASSIDDALTIVVVVRSDKLPAIWGAAKGRTQQFSKFKPWEEDKICGRIVEEAKALGMSLASDVPLMLYRLIGDDLQLTVNELVKLKHITEGEVTKQLVAKVIAPNAHAEPYEVAEAVMGKELKKALQLVSTLYRTGGDGIGVPIVSSLMKQVERMIVVRSMLDNQDPPDLIATRIQVHKFIVQKTVLPRAKRFTVGQLKDHMKHLCRLETQIKGAARSKRTLVELAVISIAA